MTYSIGAFAGLAGVTVKTLHYYERRGLLAPRRTRAGYRRYTLKDLARLERIIALKKLGLPLKEIARLKTRAPVDKTQRAPSDRKEREASAERRIPFLDAHREKLLEKQRLLGEAIAAIDAVARASDPDTALRKFVGDSTWARYEAKRAEMAGRLVADRARAGQAPVPRAPDRASPSRFALFHEIRHALDRDPSGASAQRLVARWRALVEAEADGNPDTIARMRKIAATRAQWPDGARQYVASLYDADVETWERVMTCIYG